MIELYNFVTDLGYSSSDYFWFPVLVWTAVASLTFFILRYSDSINPLYQYHIRIATLLALPIGLVSAFLIQFLPTLSTSGSSTTSAVFVVQNPLSENVAQLQVPEAASIPWFSTNFIIGSATLLIAIIAVLLFFKLLVDYLKLKSLHNNLEKEALTNLESEYGLKDHSVSVAFNDHPLVPFTFGWRNPVIVLPSSIKNNKENLNMAIRHELVHIQRGDYLLQLLISMISSLFWFHPLVRLSNNKIETYREISCDQQVLNTSGIHPKKYATMLFELVPLQKGIGSFAVNMAVQQSTLKQRIEKMKYHKLHQTSLKKSFLIFLGMILIVIAPIACSDLQGPKGVSPEELSQSKLEMRGITLSINGKEVLKQSEQVGAKSTALSALFINANEYGVFKISPMQFKGGTLAGSVNGNDLNFKINSLNVEIESNTDFLDIDGDVDIWVEHSIEQFDGFSHGVAGAQTSVEEYISDHMKRRNNPPLPPASEDIPDDIFVVVENMPELIGGQVGIQSKVEYPPVAIRAGIEGRVTVQFIVDKDGNVTNPKVIRGIGGGCDEEALRVVSNAKFKPGTQRGRNVAVQMSIPVLFKLSDSKFQKSESTENSPPPPPPRPMKIETLESSNGAIKVKLSNGTDPLVGATVSLKDGSKGVATDREGIAIIDGLDKGTYNIVASFVGYGKPEKEITVN